MKNIIGLGNLSRQEKKSLLMFSAIAATLIVGAVIYVFLAIFDHVPLDREIFLSILLLLLIGASFVFFWVWERRERLTLGMQVAALLSAALVYWYWFFAPIYYQVVMFLNSVQLKFTAFVFIWEVPIIGGAFIALALSLFRPIHRYLSTGETSDPELLYEKVRLYPSRVALWIFLFSILGYLLGSLQIYTFADLSNAELLKSILNGFVVSLLLAIFYRLALSRMLSDVRRRIKSQYNLLTSVHRSVKRKMVAVFFLTIVASFLLINLGVFRILQDVVVNNIEARLSVEEEQDIVLDLDLRTVALFVSLESEELIREMFTDESRAELLEDPDAVVTDYKGSLKSATVIENTSSGPPILVVIPHQPFYERITTPALKFFAAQLLVLLILFILTLYISGNITVHLRQLSRSVRGHRKVLPKEIPIFATDDEIEELSHALAYLVEQARQYEEGLEREGQHLWNALKREEERNKLLTQMQELLFQVISSMEEELETIEQAKEREEILLHNIGYGIISTDDEGNVVKINKATEDLLGWKEEEILGKHFVSTIPMTHKSGKEVQSKDRPITRAIKQMAEMIGSYVYIAKNGSGVPVRVRVTPIMFHGELIGTVEVFRRED